MSEDFTPQEKIARLEALVEMDPEDYLGYFLLGKLYLDTDQYARSAEMLEKCLELKPDYSAAWRFCGDAWRKSGDLNRARATYERGIVVAEANGDLQTVKEMKALLGKLTA